MDRSRLRLYFICGSNNVEGDPLQVIEEALRSGVTMFQLREKGTNSLKGEELFKFASEVKGLCHKYGVPFIINDAPELAQRVGADGIHLGQDDLDVSLLPSYFDDKIIGLSVANQKELENSNMGKADYVGTGPVFSTLSKNDAGEAIGVEGLQEMRGLIGEMPMVAIGGITQENYQICLESGADGVSLISAIAGAGDVENAVQNFL
ncbi:thiamine phosphate synthase [Salinicoccus sp. HZC-1]|uniref:thiamine phosphate synthase n=1 Tax=Salinicoccus sp. HZC-1 TaxID=3385497 RepID=UPI00398A7C90